MQVMEALQRCHKSGSPVNAAGTGADREERKLGRSMDAALRRDVVIQLTKTWPYLHGFSMFQYMEHIGPSRNKNRC